MKKLVIFWILLGSFGYLLLPWYSVYDGFFNFAWLLEYNYEDHGSGFYFSFIENYWLLPFFIFLFLPLLIINRKINDIFYSNIFLVSGIIGFLYFFLQGFSIGIRGWNYEVFQTIFGDVNRQYGIGIGAVLTISTFIFYITHGLSSRGWLNGDNFIVGSIWFIIILVSIFVFFPIISMFNKAKPRPKIVEENAVSIPI